MKILLVDDDVDVNISLGNAFSVYGLEYDSFIDSSRALESYKEAKYDLVVTDFKMPGLNGVDFFYKIKDINSNAKIIMMSAYADETLIQKCLDDGIFAFLKKPLNMNELIRLCVYLNE